MNKVNVSKESLNLSDIDFPADDVLDTLLDQEGLEVDPVDRMEADTPLHKAVRFVNDLPKTEWENGSSLVEILLDAGADPRLVNLRAPTPVSRHSYTIVRS